jgi:ABC-type sugar transport system ATPase subunit
MAAVDLETLTKDFANGVRAVNGMSLSVRDGELLVLVGASGSGKTTVLRLIAGLERPSCGRVRLAGADVSALPPWRRNVALVFQQPALYPHLNVAANLKFSVEQRERPATLRRWASWLLWPRSRREYRARAEALTRRVEDVAAMLSIAALVERFPAELSGGEQQRVALGRALVRQPAVLLLDEPFSHLDTQLRQELRRELHLLHRRLPVTILCVTHDPQEALALGDRVAVMDRGALLQVAEPRELSAHPAHRRVAGVLGWPDGNFLDGVLLFVQETLYFVREDLRWPLPPTKQEQWSAFVNRPVTLGLPPDCVSVGGSTGHPVEMEVVQLEGWHPGAPVLCRTAGVRLQGRLSELAEPGSVVRGLGVMVRLELERAQLFDAQSGRALAEVRSTA